ncbi:CaiB/BaiF CoA-transferase family protein [Geodermatophilus sp. DSM 44513]|uniref:CaiB/BaiF CoA transferase family protein n=1 Tax=Geodermatophilus sp. DSM 44513 TaxID=1528104 RepID=UPI00127F6771|nr:CoA transferase [Geodermatophilus sp. DSM 44513]WNV74166.1 CoA transferase [Geodermatophilus sp. DSM 44513]
MSAPDRLPHGPLTGVRVLDLTQVLAGPYCTMTLADLGADVIKVEGPDRTARAMGPAVSGEDGAVFLALHRNKRSFTVDLKDDDGRQALLDLVATADVLVENYRPGVMARLGTDFPTLHALHPRLVYASISGFGQTGPYAQRPGYDIVAQGMSGIMSVTGAPGGPPMKAGLPVTDLAAGLVAANAVLAALLARVVTGEGQHVDTSLFDAALSMSVWEATQLWTTAEVPGPLGSAHRGSAPYQALRAADGYLVVAANKPHFWRNLCAAVDRPHLADDPRFATNADRLAHLDELVPELEAALAGRTVEEWVDMLLAADVPAGPVLDYAQSLADPHTRARGMVQVLDHPVEGPLPSLGIPAKLSGTPGTLRRAAPLQGEHTVELLDELGYDRARIDRLLAQGSVFAPRAPTPRDTRAPELP